MKLTKYQSGFSPVVIPLILLALGIISFTGWKVYQTSKTVEPIASSTAPSTPAKPETKPDIPEGFVEYKNEELGFRFAYPKEWGEAETEKMPGSKEYIYDSTSSNPEEGVGNYIISFSARSERPENILQGSTFIHSGLLSTDHVYAPKGGTEEGIVSYCKIGDNSGLVYRKSEQTANGYRAAGTQCLEELEKGETIKLTDSAILIPKICAAVGCDEDAPENLYKTMLIIQTGIEKYPGLKFIDYSRTESENFKKIASTYKRL